MKNLMILALILVSSSAWASNEGALTLEEIQKETDLSSLQVRKGRKYWVEIQGVSDTSASEKGTSLTVGRRFRFFAIDLKGEYARLNYGALHAEYDGTQPYTESASNPEPLRPRSNQDAWRYYAVEPGISVDGRLFPHMVERARAGFSLGRFHDSANNLNYLGTLFSAETGLEIHTKDEGPYALSFNLGWKFGELSAGPDPSYPQDGHRQIPVSWLMASMGIIYFF